MKEQEAQRIKRQFGAHLLTESGKKKNFFFRRLLDILLPFILSELNDFLLRKFPGEGEESVS